MQILHLFLYLLTTSEYYKQKMTKIGITSNMLETYYTYFEPINDNWTFLAIYNISGTNETLQPIYSNLDHPNEQQLRYNWYPDVLPTSIEKFLHLHNVDYIVMNRLIDAEQQKIIFETNANVNTNVNTNLNTETQFNIITTTRTIELNKRKVTKRYKYLKTDL